MCFLCSLVLCLGVVLSSVFAVEAKKEKKPTEESLFSAAAESELKEWTVLIYMNACGQGAQAMHVLNEVAAAIRTETTNAVALCNYAPHKAWVWEMAEKHLIQKKHISDLKSHAEVLPLLMRQVVVARPAKKYAIILWGQATGPVDFVYDAALGQWVYPAPVSFHQASSGSDGDDELSSVKRGILYDNESGTALQTEELYGAIRQVKRDLGKRLELLVTDAYGMASMELASALADSVVYLTGFQEYQSVMGLAYPEFFNDLNKKRVGTEELTKSVVGSLRFAPYAGSFVYSGIECAQAGAAHMQFYLVISSLQKLLAAQPLLAPAVYGVRLTTWSSALNYDYVDVQAWLREVCGVIAARASLAGSAQDPLVLSFLSWATQLLVALQQAVVARISDESLAGVSGLSLYYPTGDAVFPLRPQQDPWHAFLAESVAALNANGEGYQGAE